MATEVNENFFLRMSKALVPTGRAFRIGWRSNKEKLFRAFAKTQNQFFNDAMSTLDSIIPDNDNFTAQDASDGERRWGLVNGSAVPLSDRKMAIRRKMASPGTNPAKAHFLWLQTQLQAAGFGVYVYENVFPAYPSGWTRVWPGIINGAVVSETQQGQFEQGGSQQGGYINSLVANSIYNAEDISFQFGQDYGGVFFIGGTPLGTYANVLAVREIEFRQLILGLKQQGLSAVLFINYI